MQRRAGSLLPITVRSWAGPQTGCHGGGRFCVSKVIQWRSWSNSHLVEKSPNMALVGGGDRKVAMLSLPSFQL